MSIIIDYSDLMLVPHLADEPKSWGHLHHLPLQICGILNHGKRLGQLHTHWPVYSKGPNVILSHLWNHIHQVMEQSGHHPPVLYLQMDNCGLENKNVYTLGFLSQLIYLGYFHEIELSFLPAGHTHEDIGQCFSIFRKQLHDHNVYCPADCHGFLDSCYSSLSHKPDSSLANFSWEVVDTHGSFHDWKSFLTPHMVEVSQHSQPHHFHFTYSHQAMLTLIDRMPRGAVPHATSAGENVGIW